jgi:hypothetical protein
MAGALPTAPDRAERPLGTLVSAPKWGGQVTVHCGEFYGKEESDVPGPVDP